MIGFELRWLGWDMDVIDHCTRSKGNLNRNPYCSCSHSIPIPLWTMKRNERERWVCGWRWVGFVIVGDDCYGYAVVYALSVFLSMLLFCFRWFVLVFMNLLFNGVIEYCIYYVMFIIVWLDKRSLVDWYILFLRLLNQVFCVVCSWTCEGSSLSVPIVPLRNPTTNCNSIPLTITYHNPLLIFRESRIRVWR